ncbi:MAG: TetR family transcriptional regulator [Rhizobiaceae bacterium]|nr:TetR family transcriptional regulator [Rhizobiaceae bacterium]
MNSDALLKRPASASPAQKVRVPGKGVDASGKKLKKADITRVRILDAAAHVFRQKGYALTRISDIAKLARTQSSSIYYHFESREAIVEEVLRIANGRTRERVINAIGALPRDASVRDRIGAAIHGHLEIVLAGDHYIAAHIRIFDQLPADLRKRFLRVLDENAELWRTLLNEAQSEGMIRSDLDLSVIRQLLIGMMNWSVEWYRVGRLSPPQIADQIAVLFFDGVTKR